MNNLWLIQTFKKEIEKHNNICETLFDERFSTAQHEDKWHDELFRDYQRSRIRLEFVVELVEKNYFN